MNKNDERIVLKVALFCILAIIIAVTLILRLYG